MSVTKPFTGTLDAVLVAEGNLDEDSLVTEYIPELMRVGCPCQWQICGPAAF